MTQAIAQNSKEVQSDPIVKKNAVVQTEHLLKKVREPEEEKLDKDQQQQDEVDKNESVISGLNMVDAKSKHSEEQDGSESNSSENMASEDSLNERIEELMYDKKKPPKNKLLEAEEEDENLDVVSQQSEAEITQENQKLEYHARMYRQNSEKFDRIYSSQTQQIEEIRDFFSEHKIKIIKLNHSVDPNIQRFTQFQGYL